MFRSTSMMPVMTGEEAVRELRKRGCRVFVVGATGNALKGERVGRLENSIRNIMLTHENLILLCRAARHVVSVSCRGPRRLCGGRG